MAKITRVLAKIFGSNANPTEIGVFGSLAAGSPATTTSALTMQSLSNWLDGWFGAVVGENSPAIEDMNAFCYVMSYQIAYLLQTGVEEWSATTTYYIGSVANDGTGILYVSLTNTNLNNAVTDTVNWRPLVNSLYQVTLGSAAQIAQGLATHSTWASAISAVSTGGVIFVLPGAWTENVTINKNLKVVGSGYGSVLTGSITFTAASNCIVSGVQLTLDVTLDSSSNGNSVYDMYLASGKTFLDSGTGNLLEGIQA